MSVKVIVSAIALLGVGMIVAKNESSQQFLQDSMSDAIHFIKAQGEMGPVYYTLFLGLWIVLLLPCSIVEIVPGFLFGMRIGFWVSLGGKCLGVLMSQLLCRLFLRNLLREKLMKKYPLMNAISSAIEEEGLPVLIIVRLSYIPMVVKNYGLGVLDIPTSKFLFAAIISGFPFSLLWSFIGSSSQSLSSILQGEKKITDGLPEDQTSRLLLLFSVVLMLCVFLYMIAKIQKRVQKKMDEISNNNKKENIQKVKEEEEEEKKAPLSNFPVIIGVFVLASIGGLGYYYLNKNNQSLKDVMLQAVTWIRAQGDMGPIYYSVFLAIWVAALLPCSILEMVPGFLFGFKTGVVVSIVGKNIGTIISLLIGRYILRDFMQKRLLSRYPVLIALERAVKQEGFPVLIMIRCAYLPMLIKNYGLSCLDISIFQIWVASLFASFPFASLWTFVGASAQNLGEIFEGKLTIRDILPDDLLVVGTIAAIFVLGFVYLFTTFMGRFRNILKQIQEEDDTKKIK